MTIGIIAAMTEELEILLKDLRLEEKKEKANMTFHKGKVYGKEVVAVVCGIGKVNSAICTQILVSEYNVDKIINKQVE
jgi:adenosylhomocysteine nucleosidase